MKIWITGCAGFLGRRLALRLGADNEVVGLSRRISLAPAKAIQVDLSHPDSEEIINQTIATFGPPDVVIHAASRQPGAGSFAAFTRANVTATQSLLDGLAATPPRQIIFTSTISVYSPSQKLPYTEGHPASAATPYGATKKWAEQVIATAKDSQILTLRLPSLYGVGQADSFIDGLAKTALQDGDIELFSKGEVVRDALHVDDVVRVIDKCVKTPPAEMSLTMNIGNGSPIKTIEYAESLVAALDSKSKIIVSERATSHVDAYMDVSLARQAIGFRPTDMKEAMRVYAAELRASS